jgi:hypothetical protein
MRRDHGLAGLIAPLVVSGLAGAVALAGWLGPQVADAPQPLFGDRFAGWALLAAGVAAAWRGRAPVGLLLLAAGAGWVAVAALTATYVPPEASRADARTALRTKPGPTVRRWPATAGAAGAEATGAGA